MYKCNISYCILYLSRLHLQAVMDLKKPTDSFNLHHSILMNCCNSLNQLQ